MSLSKSESDVILNRANVALSRSQRLVASWLPAQTADEQSNPKTEEELQREEDEIFTAIPETPPRSRRPLPEKAADGSWNRTELSSNDKLRKQLLGRNYEKVMKAAAANKPAAKSATVHARWSNVAAEPENKPVEESDDEEDGRVAMVGRKRKAAPRVKTKKLDTVQAQSEDKNRDQDQDQDQTIYKNGDEATSLTEATPTATRQAPSKGRKKATSYLDEILASRAKKRKK
ncbi:hypothetical protein N7495_007106 [Penicillium taxi]|uniref:uncharacterized protein n=1 Tax=Penicillium taxi TaxID=168475 RepID=UPI00254546E4|nr:uncharacterized protein N7495_007106 [Penicillium taxi]KAJ5895415.1 hypothetical protein N7495_007106 [Penicillium taxi]